MKLMNYKAFMLQNEGCKFGTYSTMINVNCSETILMRYVLPAVESSHFLSGRSRFGSRFG